MSSDEQEALHMIGSHRLEESPFLEAEKSSTDRGEGSADPAVRLIVKCCVGVSPGQEGIVLRIKTADSGFLESAEVGSDRLSGPSEKCKVRA